MGNKNEPDVFEQLSIFQIVNMLDDRENTFSSEDISKIIDKLSGVKRKKESIEAKKRQQEERKRREREAREAKERKESHIKEVTSMELPLDWENVFNTDERTQGVHADSISDGLILSLSNLGKVDIEYISSITGEDYKTIIGALKGSIYQNPETWGECFYKGWETSEEYLSGNMMRKWKVAKEADKEYNGYFSENIKAIEKVLPPTVATKDIYVTLGSPWVPADIIDDFIEYNSWSGSRVTRLPDSDKLFPSGCSDECTSSLHINSVKPDVIIVYLGTNDWAFGAEIDGTHLLEDEYNMQYFSEAYEIMLGKIKANYPNAENWCCTLNTTFMSSNPSFKFPYTYGGTHIEKYNQIIKDTADIYKCKVIDLYDYHLPYDSIDGSHPNVDGMNTLAMLMIREIGGQEIDEFMDCENGKHKFSFLTYGYDQGYNGGYHVCEKCGKIEYEQYFDNNQHRFSVEDSAYHKKSKYECTRCKEAMTMKYIATISNGYSWEEIYYDSKNKKFISEKHHAGSVDDAADYYDGSFEISCEEVYSKLKSNNCIKEINENKKLFDSSRLEYFHEKTDMREKDTVTRTEKYDPQYKYADMDLSITRCLFDNKLKLFVESKAEDMILNQDVVSIGRDNNCDICLDYPEISKQHARFYYEGSTWFIADTNSANGIWLNGNKIEPNTKYELFTAM